MSYNGADLIFPHLGIVIEHLGRSITLPGGFTIAYYGMIIAAGMLVGVWFAGLDYRRKGLSSELISDYAIFAIPLGIIGARIYYVIFEWEYYRGDLLKMINIREGGLAIYGGVITGIIVAIIFTRIKKLNFLCFTDSFVLALLIGQVFGRWGNFFNCEAFGGYTDSLFAMRIKEVLVSNTSMISDELRAHMISDAGFNYIQVHPTFLYESCWNLVTLLVLIWFGRHRQTSHGQVFGTYLITYGIGRFLIEGLRTDSLLLPGTGIAVSQLVSVLLLAAGILIHIYTARHKGSPAD